MPTAVLHVIVESSQARSEIQKLDQTMQKVSQQGDRVERSLSKVTDQSKLAAAAQRQLRRAFTALVGIQTARKIIQIGNAFIGYDNALTAALGSTREARAAMAFVREEADRLGLPVDKLAEGFTKLSASARGTALEGRPLREIFSSINEAARVMNLSTAETEGVLRAVTQIMSKGKVAAEELRGQLGERLPGAVRLLAEGLGVTQQELDKMLEQGQILADEALPRFAERLRETTAAGLELAQNSPAASFDRLRNSILELANAIAQSGFLDTLAVGAEAATFVIGGLAKVMGDLLKAFVAFAVTGAVVGLVRGINALAVANNVATVAAIRLTAAQARQAVQMRITAAAAGRLGTVMKFLGGPVGIAVAAGTALLTFGASAVAASGDTDMLADSVDSLLGKMEAVEQRQIESALTATQNLIATQLQQIADNARLIQQIIDNNPTVDRDGQRVFGRGDEERIARLRDENEALARSLIENEERVQGLIGRLGELGQASEGAAASQSALNREQAELAKTTDRLNQIYAQATEETDPLIGLAFDYAETMKELNETLAKNPDLQDRILIIQQAVTDEYQRAAREAMGLTEAQKELADASAQVTRVMQGALQQVDPLAAATNDYRATMERLNQIADKHPELLEQVRAAQQAVGRAFEDTKNRIREQSDELGDLNRNFTQLVQELDPVQRAMMDYVEGVKLLNDAIANGLVTSTAEVQRLMQLLGERFQQARTRANEVKEEADPFKEAWVGAIERIDSVFAEAWRGAFDSFDSFKDRLLDAFKNLLAEMAHLAITRPIVMQFASAVSGFFGGGQGGGGFGSGAAQAGIQAAQQAGIFGQAGQGVAGGNAISSLGAFFGASGAGGAAITATGGFSALALSALGPLALLGLGASQGPVGGAIGGGLAGGIFASTASGAALLGASSLATGTAAATGAQLGSVVPVLGTIIGAVLGAALGRVFNNNTNTSSQVSFGSSRGPQDIQVSEDFGGVFLGSGRDGFIEQQGQFAEVFETFFTGLSIAVNESQREAITNFLQNQPDFQVTRERLADGTFLTDLADQIFGQLEGEVGEYVRSFSDITDQLNALQLGNAAQALIDATGDRFANLAEAIEFLGSIATDQDPNQVAAAIVQLAQGFETAITGLQAFVDSNAAEDYAAAVELANSTLAEQLAFVDETIRDLVGSIDPANASVEQLAAVEQAVVARYQLELQLIQQIDEAAAAIATRFSSTIDFIRSTQQTDEERYNDLTDRAEALAALLPTLNDPQQILDTAAEIDRLTREAFGLLNPEQQAQVAPEFITFLEDANALAQQALADARDAALQSAEDSRALIQQLVDQLPEPLILAANALIAAADALNPAGAQDPTDPAVDPSFSTPPGGGGFDPNRFSPNSDDGQKVGELSEARERQEERKAQIIADAVSEAVGAQTDAMVAGLGVVLSEFVSSNESNKAAQQQTANLLAGISRNGVQSRSRGRASNVR